MVDEKISGVINILLKITHFSIQIICLFIGVRFLLQKFE